MPEFSFFIMYLEKLEIQGFKSFANKNTLLFPGIISESKRGLTSIVGPNGSGKSNIADAVRWVLGEQSLKTLRGKKSEDVIFSGSDQKSQLSFAEVSLILNNDIPAAGLVLDNEPILKSEEETKNTAPLNFDAVREFLKSPKITITRRLFRSGESEYLINGKRVRLADVQMLLAKANVGQKTYSIIGQGMVENFLNTSASERKDFFDEATGIKEFQIKRDLSINKLESSYENLQQVEMLLTEIKPRLKSLTRQVEKLKHRDELEKELRTHQLNYYGYLYQEASKKLKEANNNYLTLEKERFTEDDRLSELESTIEKMRATNNREELNAWELELNNYQKEKDQIWRELTKIQAELEHQLDSQGQYDISWLKTKNQDLTNSINTTEQELNNLPTELVKKELESNREELSLLDKELTAAKESLIAVKKQEAEKGQCLQEIARLDAILKVSREFLNFDSQASANEKKVLTNAVADCAAALITATEAVNQSKKKENQAAEKISSLNNSLNETRSQVAQLKDRLKKSELKSGKLVISATIERFLDELERLKEETDSARLKARLKESKEKFASEIKEILDYGAESEAEQLKDLQELLITLGQEKQTASDTLTDLRLKVAATEEQWRIASAKHAAAEADLKKYQETIEKASQTKNEANAAQEKKDLLIKEAEKLEQKIKAVYELDNSSTLEESRRQAQERLSSKNLELNSLLEKKRLLQNRLEELKQEQIEIQNKIRKSEIKFDASNLEEKIVEAQKEIDAISQKITIVQDKIKVYNTTKEAETAQLFALQRQADEKRRALNSLATQLNDWQVVAAKQEAKLENLESNIRDANLDLLLIKNHLLETENIELERWREKITQFQNQLDLIGGIDPETETEFNQTKERFDFLSNQIADLNQAIISLEKIISELDSNIKARFDQEFALISEKFSEYFKILFNGGEAKVFKLSDPENPEGFEEENLEQGLSERNLRKIKRLKKRNSLGLSGIEIQATPPGKKIKTVSMLSGGERALTAIALICAIISANPSPFVILDEVDAALDEANSERLAQILDDLSNQTQFIVITHNRASMKRSQVLYGVTMKSDGISQLLSVKLEDAPIAKR